VHQSYLRRALYSAKTLRRMSRDCISRPSLVVSVGFPCRSPFNSSWSQDTRRTGLHHGISTHGLPLCGVVSLHELHPGCSLSRNEVWFIGMIAPIAVFVSICTVRQFHSAQCSDISPEVVLVQGPRCDRHFSFRCVAAITWGRAGPSYLMDNGWRCLAVIRSMLSAT